MVSSSLSSSFSSLSTSLPTNQNTACKQCGSSHPCIPTVAVPCNHVYCYYCISKKMAESPRNSICQCGQKIESFNSFSMRKKFDF